MSDNTTAPAKRGGKAVGFILIAASVGFGAFVYAHRPPEGVGDMLHRSDSFFFKEGVYYTLLALSALLGLSGLVRLLK